MQTNHFFQPSSSLMFIRLQRCLSIGFTACLLLLQFEMTVAAEPLAVSDDRPNVIVVLADDQGWGDLSLHGNPNLSTPNIDSIARSGAHVDNFYVCAVCSPTRAEFLTGRYHTRMGVYSTSAGGERFNVDEQTIADVFRASGYATAAFGKWHSGMQWPYHPNARGFDEFYGFCSGHWGHYFDPMLEHNGRIVQGDGFIIDDLTNRAIEFATAERNHPYLIYLALNTPHSPMQVPQPYWDRFADKTITPDPRPENAKRQKLDHTRAALAMVENIDDNIGKLLAALRAAKQVENTIVVYFSDNGPNGARFNGGMRGRKGSTHEGGLRSPCVIQFPKRIKPNTKIDSISGAIDLLPTLAELAGIGANALPDKPLDGVSIANQLTGGQQDNTVQRRLIFSHWRGGETVRSQRYRMHSSGQLFDIQNDRGEHHDLSGEKPAIKKRLASALGEWSATIPPKPGRATRAFPLAHPDAVWTQLPARDATFTGSIKRSNRFPNCTYLLNWSDTTSEIHWNVDVLASGTFEVEMYYVCPADQTGSTIELSLGDAKLVSKIQSPSESPLIGAEEDRVERQEGYVRRWNPMTLGQIELPKGQGTLRLKATKVAGKEVAEMRLLMFRRVD